MKFTHQCGHISVERGPPICKPINWAKFLKLADYGQGPPSSLDDLELHMLYGLETRLHQVHSEFYLSRGDIRLHTDDMLQPGMLTIGIILACESDFRLSTGRNLISLSPGDCFILDPSKRHGSKTTGFLAFASQDFRGHDVPTINDFRASIIRDLAMITDHHHLQS